MKITEQLFNRWTNYSLVWRTLILFLFFCSVVLTRNYLETYILAQKAFGSYYVTLHHCSWYYFVVLFYMVSYRYIALASKEVVSHFFLISPLILIPLIYAVITGSPMDLAYLKGKTVGETAFQILILMYGHERNQHVFYELAILVTSMTISSYYFSRSYWRTILNVVVAFYGSFIIGGIHWVGVYPKTKAIFKIHTVFRNHHLLSMVYFGACVLFFFILVLPELKAFFDRNKLRKYLTFLGVGLLFFVLISIYSLNIGYVVAPRISDYLFLILPSLVVISFCWQVVRRDVPLPVKIYFGLYSIWALLIIVPIMLGFQFSRQL
jgi:hypothetical protein